MSVVFMIFNKIVILMYEIKAHIVFKTRNVGEI